MAKRESLAVNSISTASGETRPCAKQSGFVLAGGRHRSDQDPTLQVAGNFLTFDRESEQYLCAALLRHGKAVASDGTVGLLSRLLPLLRRAFPRARSGR